MDLRYRLKVQKCITINKTVWEQAVMLGFENLSFHTSQWLKNWVEMKQSAQKPKEVIGVI